MYFFADQRHIVVGMELKGPDNSLRVRQIRMLGEIEGGTLKVGKQLSAQTIQQRNCEAETLKVFRLITSQVSTHDFSQLTFRRNIFYNVTLCIIGIWETYTRREATTDGTGGRC